MTEIDRSLSIGEVGPCRGSMNLVALDSNGLHLRPATEGEAAAYLAQPLPGKLGSLPEAFKASFFTTVKVGEVFVSEDRGSGVWFGGAGF